jgi:hypothetical protein
MVTRYNDGLVGNQEMYDFLTKSASNPGLTVQDKAELESQIGAFAQEISVTDKAWRQQGRLAFNFLSTDSNNNCHIIFENKNEYFADYYSYDKFGSNNYTQTNRLTFKRFPMVYDTVVNSFKPDTTNTNFISTLTFNSAGGVVEPVGGHTYPYAIDTTSTQFFDVWTDNGGSAVYVLKKGV